MKDMIAIWLLQWYTREIAFKRDKDEDVVGKRKTALIMIGVPSRAISSCNL